MIRIKYPLALVFGAFILAGLASAADLGDVFVLTLKYDQGNISIEKFLTTKAIFYPPANQPKEGYNLSIISFNDKALYSEMFNFPLETHYAPDPRWFDSKGNQIYFPSENETTAIKDTATVELMLPYFENAYQIRVKDAEGVEVLSYTVNQRNYLDSLKKEPVNSKENLDYIKKTFYWIAGGLLILVILVLVILKVRSRSATK